MWKKVLKKKAKLNNMFVRWVFRRSLVVRMVVLVLVLAVQVPCVSIVYFPKLGLNKVILDVRKGIHNAVLDIKQH